MEQQDVLNESELYTHKLASKGKRFANYLIDVIAFYILIIPIALVMGESLLSGGGMALYYFLVFGIMVGYYTFMEHKFGKTLGKMLTKCKVIDDATGGKPDLRQAFLRSLSRLVPFEGFSLLFSEKAWHDSWVDTSVVEDVPAV